MAETGRRAGTQVVSHLWPSPPISAISWMMLVVDRVELLQVRPHHLDLALDEFREFLLCRQDDLLVCGCFLARQFCFAWSAIHVATGSARAMLCSRPA